MTTLELTTNESTVLAGIAGIPPCFSYFDEGVSVGSHTWSHEFAYEVGELLGISEKAAGGVISSLIQKGIFTSSAEFDDIALELTQIGVEAIGRVRA